jgi:tetratricopeptide (TPR) repeat protein
MTLLVVVLFLWLAQSQSQEERTPKQPDFYDKPQFVVSGVTDYTYRGGHGSDSVLRSTETLTKGTVSLSNSFAVESMPLSEAIEKEKSLKENIAREPGNAELHHELAEIEERLGISLEAVHEYQRAAELNASESNLFDWGAELLKHRAGEPAIALFQKGKQLFPESVRMQLGLAVAFYLQKEYENAAQNFFAASDLHPHDSAPYLFLAQVQAKEITESSGYRERLERFVRLQPNNASANYYYAACLWEQQSEGAKFFADRAVQLDAKLAPAYLLLGVIDSRQNDVRKAISMFQKATAVNPEFAEAHYRLAQAYELSGETARAQEERATYKKLSDESAQKAELERKQLQQFVITLRDAKAPSEK